MDDSRNGWNEDLYILLKTAHFPNVCWIGKKKNKLRNGIWDASKKLRTENGGTCKPTEHWQKTAVKCRKGKHSDQEKKKKKNLVSFLEE